MFIHLQIKLNYILYFLKITKLILQFINILNSFCLLTVTRLVSACLVLSSAHLTRCIVLTDMLWISRKVVLVYGALIHIHFNRAWWRVHDRCILQVTWRWKHLVRTSNGLAWSQVACSDLHSFGNGVLQRMISLSSL